jgi:hypothetical protein
MPTRQSQLAIEYKGQEYSGVYSVSGNLVIARIPGISSASAQLEGEEIGTATRLLTKILEEAEALGTL